MGKTYALDRVATDLARGLTHPAIQRLSSLVAAYPTDLDLRRRLAAVHRRVGNQIQAGRWDYLTIGADAGDTSAFERAFPSAVARLRAVRWPVTVGAAPTSYARSRLAKLAAAADAEVPGTAALASGPAAGIRPPGQPRDRINGGPAAAGNQPGTDRKVTGAELGQQILRGEWAGLVRSARALVQSWHTASVLLFALAVGVTAALIAVGAATVVEWLLL